MQQNIQKTSDQIILIQPSVIQEKVIELHEQILKDQKIKIKQDKYLKYFQQTQQYYDMMPNKNQEKVICLFAGIYKNIGRITNNIQALDLSIKMISQLKKYEHVAVRWYLQMAAHKSSKKMHEQCYKIAFQSFQRCKHILQQRLMIFNENSEQDHFIRMIYELSQQVTKDQIIWLINDRNLTKEMVAKIKQKYKNVEIPFYPQEQFQIADYMSLEQCPLNWQTKQILSYKQIIKYLSISAFTMATQKYYQKQYTQKHNHLKALQISLAAFPQNCNYINFLLEYLLQHFGKRMIEIKEQKNETTQMIDLRRDMPKDLKQVNLKNFKLPIQ